MRSYLMLFPLPLALGLAILATLLILSAGQTVQSNYWETESYRRKLALADTAERKMLIVAGSNVYFGLKAHAFEEATSIRTVNLGVQGALSFDFMAELIKPLLRPRDLVLLPLEYTFYANTHNAILERTNTLQASVAWSLRPSYILTQPIAERLTFIRHLSYRRLWEGVRSRLEPPLGIVGYRVEGIDQWGDNTIDYRDAKTASALAYSIEQEQARGLPQFDPASRRVGDIERFVAWASEHGVEVLAAFPNTMDAPPFQGPLLASLRKDIVDLWNSLGIPFVDDPLSATVSADMALDTPYHPTLEGAQLRTSRLVRRMCMTVRLCKS